MINKTQKHILSLLKEFDAFCRNNDIKYTLHGGTLLGSIREKGFIPWDDDADVAMAREDYNKFISIISSSKTIQFDYNSNPYKIYTNKNNVYIWIDIFVYDYISEHKLAGRLKIIFEDIFMSFLKNDKHLATTKAKWSYPKYLFIKCVSYIGKLFPEGFRKKTLYFIREKCFCGKKMFVHRSNDHHVGRLEILPKSILEEYVDIKFENTKLMVSKEYEKILIASYGKDYMIPKKPDNASLLGHELTRNNINENIIDK